MKKELSVAYWSICCLMFLYTEEAKHYNYQHNYVCYHLLLTIKLQFDMSWIQEVLGNWLNVVYTKCLSSGNVKSRFSNVLVFDVWALIPWHPKCALLDWYPSSQGVRTFTVIYCCPPRISPKHCDMWRYPSTRFYFRLWK